MQCFDCHNRPAHAFQMPDRAVDRALMLGRMSPTLPFLKKQAVEILRAPYESSAAAAAAIPAALASYYESAHPEVSGTRASDVAEAGEVIADIYSRNVFPEAGVDWGTYPDNRGHQEFPGCFRCHGGEHTAATGETITNNCFRCHHPAAVEETKPEVLQALGRRQAAEQSAEEVTRARGRPAHRSKGLRGSGAQGNTRFQSSLMLTTVQPLATASSRPLSSRPMGEVRS